MIRINDAEFATFTQYLKNNFGINLTKKRTLIESRLSNYLVSKGFNNYQSYFKYAFNDKTGKEMSEIINYLTTNYSYFMREWDHFKYFKENVLPELKSSIKDNDLRTWSAGCSTGQEPYTLAMLTTDYLKEQNLEWDATVLATDISIKALDIAKEGVYNEEYLKQLPIFWKLEYFNNIDNKWEVKKRLKEEIVFRRFNLMEKFPFRNKFHVIFCRNVMIYFDDKTKKELINKFYDSIEDGGYLFIGQSETLNRADNPFEYILPSIYKKVV